MENNDFERTEYKDVKRYVNVYNTVEASLYQKIIKLKEEAPVTNWFKELTTEFYNGVSNAFLLAGNVGDYVIPEYKLEDYLILQLGNYLGIEEVAISRFCMTNNFENYYFESNSNWWTPREVNRDIITRLLNGIVQKNKARALIVYYPEYLLPKNSSNDSDLYNIVKFNTVLSSNDLSQSNNIIIFISDSKESIDDKITNPELVTTINIDFPTLEERKDMINHLYSNYKLKVEEGFSLDALASNTGGLTRKGIEDIWLSSMLDGIITKKSILDKKTKRVRDTFGDKLEIYEADGTYTLDKYGGMEHIKDYIKTGIIKPINEGNTDIIPKGLLFSGVPGSGKTYLAKCIAGSSGLSFISLNFGSLEDMYVGETERNLEKALSCIKSLMPCFVFIDEIDETLRRSSPTENNAVRGNVFKRMMEFMSDPELRGKVVFIGACNHPSRLDEALKRTGRFDIKIPFMPLYNDLEREEVFKIHLSKYGYNVDIFSNDFRLVLNKTKGYTHADVEGIVVKAISLAKRRGLEVDSKLLLEASGYIKRMESEELEQMTKEALDNCNDLEFVPKYILDELYKK